MALTVSDQEDGEPPQRVILADFSRHLVERDGYPFAIGSLAEPEDPPQLARPVDLVGAVVVLKDRCHNTFPAIDDHLARKGSAFSNHGVLAVVAYDDCDVRRAIAVCRIDENLLYTRLCLGHVEHFVFGEAKFR